MKTKTTCICANCGEKAKAAMMCEDCEKVDAEIGACDFCKRYGDCGRCGGVLLPLSQIRNAKRMLEFLVDFNDELYGECRRGDNDDLPVRIFMLRAKLWRFLMGEDE